MKKLFEILFFAVVLVSLSVGAYAQEAKPVEADPTIETKYDQAKDETEVELAYMPISVEKSKLSYLGVSAKFKGKKLTQKPTVVLFIVSIVTEGAAKYPKVNNVILTADGKAVGEIVMLNLDQREFSKTETLETLGTRMNIDVFKALVKAPSVTFQMGGNKLEIDKTVVAKLVEFDKAITP